MFTTLEALVRASSKLNLTLRMDGDQMVVVVVPMGEGKDAALRQPLIITGTAIELDAGFVDAVQSYSVAHRSLAEQIETTTAILLEAEKTQSTKAQKALQKKSTPALPAPSKTASTSAWVEDGDEEDDESTSESDTPAMDANAVSTPRGPAASPVSDLQALLV